MKSSYPRVLLLDSYLSAVGGPRSYAEDLSAHLESAGVAVIRASGLLLRPARFADMVLSTLGMRGKYDVAVVHVYSGRAFLWAEAVTGIAKTAGKRVILALHGGLLPEFAARNRSRVARVLEAADAVVAPSNYIRESLACLRPDIQIIPNAIDLDAYSYRPRLVTRPRLVWLRAYHRNYQPELAVQVMAELRRTYPEATLQMYGVEKDRSLSDSRRLAEKLGVAAMIEFSGAVPKSRVGEVISSGDIFLNTSRVDNMPVTLIEAMACGVCVVSTNVGGIRYLIQDGVNGLLTPHNAPELMAEAVRRLLTDHALCHRLSTTGRAHAERFGWVHVIPQWLQLLQKTMNGK